jgi:uncharacterized protein YbaA (DUF1428 family)
MNYKEYQKSLDNISALDSKNKVLPTVKGDALVDAVKFLFDDLKFLKFKGEKIRTSTSEIDLIYKNCHTDAGTIINDLGHYILVECKNWNNKISASNVRDFAMKMQKTKVKLGLFFTKKGISGTTARDAKGEINFLFDK